MRSTSAACTGFIARPMEPRRRQSRRYAAGSAVRRLWPVSQSQERHDAAEQRAAGSSGPPEDGELHLARHARRIDERRAPPATALRIASARRAVIEQRPVGGIGLEADRPHEPVTRLRAHRSSSFAATMALASASRRELRAEGIDPLSASPPTPRRSARRGCPTPRAAAEGPRRGRRAAASVSRSALLRMNRSRAACGAMPRR